MNTKEVVAAVRELIEALPSCVHRRPDGTHMCFRPATRETFKHGFHVAYLCDEHGAGEDTLYHADALRKVQAMLDQEETEKS